MAKSLKHDTYSMEIISMDILINIFSRLPIKSLLILKSVCKSWRSLITTPYFTNLHLRLNSPSSEKLLIFVGEDHSLYSISFDFPSFAPIRIPCSSTWERFSRRKTIVGSCNGLLLCICDESSVSEALLINPSTLPCKRVPKLQVPNNCLYLSYGFGYDTLKEDYKIVRIAHFLRASFGWETMDVSVGVYSLSSDTWKLVCNVVASPFGTPVSHNGALVNNHLLHWLVSRGSVGEHRICCFDVCREEWTEVKLPFIDTDVSYSGERDLGVLDGCLCMLITGGDVWVMKEYGVQESWAKLFNILDWCVIEPLNIVPIAYSNEGNEILLRKDMFSEVYWYDVSEKRVRNVEFRCLPKYRQVSVCIRSLISLCGTS
ncbi:hypothetical protein RND81_09G140100 [Saponaria officinalis]|uniref:F-box domain-containing protein n=1 Tax=Saponaria officinalis TaxID=3572 RepID=A0AAW1ILV5_SAPOF